MKLLLLAGEESGTIYARKITDEVRSKCPKAEIRGYGDYGFEISDLAVFGIWAVLKKIGYFLKVKHTIMRAIDEWRPDVICTIDYPGMNLRIAAYAKSRGIKAVHVVCPQVWAWHQGRIPKIEAALDRLCCFLPFEPAIFKQGFAEFVGHPLVEEIKAGEYARPKREVKRLAVLPGSRMGEIEKHLPILIKVVEELVNEFGEDKLQVTIPAANDKALKTIRRIIGRSRIGARLVVTEGKARESLAQADCAVVASGTATFEAALVNCPFVLVYKVSALLAAFLKRAITGVKHVGLINVIAEKAGEKCPMPEFLQDRFTVENIKPQLSEWLKDDAANLSARDALRQTMGLLKSDGASIAKIVKNLI